MNAEQLRAAQAPWKEKYKQDPASALLTMKAVGRLEGAGVSCTVASGKINQVAGLHPAAGGGGSARCAGDMLLEALVGCAGVTLRAVATALNIPIHGGTVHAEGDMDFRGTLGVDKTVPVGYQAIRLIFELDAEATPEQLDKLIQLTERYCVVYQTLKNSPKLTSSVVRR